MVAVEQALVVQQHRHVSLLEAEAKWLRQAWESTEEKSPQERRDYLMRMLATEDAANTVRLSEITGVG
jgi:hypothetical protein